MGNPRMNCVADDRHRRPLADRGSPGRTHGNAVTNPRIRVCSTVVLTALPPALRKRSILPQPVPDNGIAHPRPTSLTTNIRVHARELDLEPDLHLLPRHPRPLLRGVEQAHRSALADHVHRPERLGSWVLITGTWYKMARLHPKAYAIMPQRHGPGPPWDVVVGPMFRAFPRRHRRKASRNPRSSRQPLDSRQ